MGWFKREDAKPLPRVVLVAGSWKPPSKTRTLIDAVAAEIATLKAVEIIRIDLAEVGHKVAGLLTRSNLEPDVQALFTAVEQADLLIVGSPIYKASYTGIFKHFFDLFDPTSLSGKPVLLTATGGSDRHALALEHQFRPLFGFFNAATIPTTVYGVDKDFVDGKIANPDLQARISRGGRRGCPASRSIGSRAQPPQPTPHLHPPHQLR